MARCKLLLFILVALSFPAALFSIQFDEYDDPDEIPQDGFDTNEYPCLKIKSKCRGTWECCRKAICVLPAWSESPVCLVPGYKEDDKLARISARDPPRLEDILYIRNMYNTTFYDFLLSDFTSPPPPLETLRTNPLDGASAGNVSIVTDGNVTAYDTVRNSSEEFYSNSYEEGSKEFMNASSFVKDFESSKPMLESTSENSLKLSHGNYFPLEMKNESDLTSDISPFVVTLPLQKLALKLSNRQSFLLLNTTVREQSKTNVSNMYNNLKNTDQFKVVVKLLKDKLKRLNEEERLGLTTNEAHPGLATELPTTTEKSSKWDVVRKFFLNKRSSSNHSTNTNIKEEISSFSEDSTKAMNTLMDRNGPHEARDWPDKRKSEETSGSSENIREIVDKFINNDKLDAIVDNIQNIDQGIGSHRRNDEDVLEFYNIDVPYRFDDQTTNEENSYKVKTSLEKTFSAIAKTISSLKPKHFKTGKKFEENLTFQTENVTSTSLNINLTTTTEIPKNSKKQVHFWQKVYLWPVRQNVSTKLAKELKSGIIWKRKLTKPGNINRVTLTEKFLLSLNSNNGSAKITDYPEQNSEKEKVSHDYSFHYSTSDESTEERYNNSYVFVMKKDPSDSKTRTKLSRILNFFHITRLNPHSNMTDPYDESSSGSPVIETSTVPEIIRLPENLTPEALQGRQLNETDLLLMEDSAEAEDKIIEEHSSSNSTFLFFFKYK